MSLPKQADIIIVFLLTPANPTACLRQILAAIAGVLDMLHAGQCISRVNHPQQASGIGKKACQHSSCCFAHSLSATRTSLITPSPLNIL